MIIFPSNSPLYILPHSLPTSMYFLLYIISQYKTLFPFILYIITSPLLLTNFLLEKVVLMCLVKKLAIYVVPASTMSLHAVSVSNLKSKTLINQLMSSYVSSVYLNDLLTMCVRPSVNQFFVITTDIYLNGLPTVHGSPSVGQCFKNKIEEKPIKITILETILFNIMSVGLSYYVFSSK